MQALLECYSAAAATALPSFSFRAKLSSSIFKVEKRGDKKRDWFFAENIVLKRIQTWELVFYQNHPFSMP